MSHFNILKPGDSLSHSLRQSATPSKPRLRLSQRSRIGGPRQTLDDDSDLHSIAAIVGLYTMGYHNPQLWVYTMGLWVLYTIVVGDYLHYYLVYILGIMTTHIGLGNLSTN